MESFSQNNSNRGPALRPRQQWMHMGVSRSTYYATRKSDPQFPKLFKLNEHGRAVFAFEGDLNAYLEMKAAEHGGGVKA